MSPIHLLSISYPSPIHVLSITYLQSTMITYLRTEQNLEMLSHLKTKIIKFQYSISDFEDQHNQNFRAGLEPKPNLGILVKKGPKFCSQNFWYQNRPSLDTYDWKFLSRPFYLEQDCMMWIWLDIGI